MRQRFISAGKQTHNEIKSFDPDVVLLDTYDLPGLSTWMVSRLDNVPVVLRVVGDRIGALKQDKVHTQLARKNYIKAIKYYVMYKLNIPTFYLCEGMIVISNDLKTRMSSQTCQKYDNIAVVPVPFRENDFTTQNPQQKRIDETNILTVINLRYKAKFEGVCDSLKAVKPLLKQDSQIQYRIAGSGEYHEDLVQYINEKMPSSVHDQIHVLGYQENIQSEYEQADLFLYFSYLEGYGKTIMEAQGMGIPVVTNRDQGMKDQVENLRTGLFVDPSDPNEVRNAINLVFQSDGISRYLCQNAQIKVKKNNSDERIGRQLIAAIKNILRKK